MKKQICRHIYIISLCLIVLGTISPFLSVGQGSGQSPLIPAVVTQPAPQGYPTPQPGDSIELPFPVAPTVPRDYEQLLEDELAYDLKAPSNIKTDVEYDPNTGYYVVRTKVGNMDIATPFLLTEKEYNDWQLRRSLQEYYRERNLQMLLQEEKQPFDILDMNFALGPLEKIFGPGGVSLKTQGSVQIKTGIKSNKTDNPSLSLSARRKTYFDFDQKIQATIN
ncbi:MAG: hypothetical protein K2K37_09035, partial [Muribaculaceae bacterium]|nr:hypothetical protein [Muribaculaceae bacterium]